jgi:hypothetical protein
MSGMPTNGSPVEIAASVLTDAALAQRLGIIRDTPRTMPRQEREAYLSEAIKRLQWGRKSEVGS